MTDPLLPIRVVDNQGNQVQDATIAPEVLEAVRLATPNLRAAGINELTIQNDVQIGRGAGAQVRDVIQYPVSTMDMSDQQFRAFTAASRIFHRNAIIGDDIAYTADLGTRTELVLSANAVTRGNSSGRGSR